MDMNSDLTMTWFGLNQTPFGETKLMRTLREDDLT